MVVNRGFACARAIRRASLRSCFVLFVSSCISDRGGSRRNSDWENPILRPDVASLRECALRYWTARRDRDWRTAYGFQPDAVREKATLGEFIEWSNEREPFQVQSFTIGVVEGEGRRGWVRIDYTTTLTRFPQAEPRTTQTWQKWLFGESGWLPTPPEEIDFHPDAPAHRDAAMEGPLRRRVRAMCEARLRGDGFALYRLTDPGDHQTVSRDEFLKAESRIEYFSCDVDWVEAIGDRGRARVIYIYRVADPSLTKLPKESKAVIEPWTLVDGEWFRDLDRPIH